MCMCLKKRKGFVGQNHMEMEKGHVIIIHNGSTTIHSQPLTKFNTYSFGIESSSLFNSIP